MPTQSSWNSLKGILPTVVGTQVPAGLLAKASDAAFVPGILIDGLVNSHECRVAMVGARLDLEEFRDVCDATEANSWLDGGEFDGNLGRSRATPSEPISLLGKPFWIQLWVSCSNFQPTSAPGFSPFLRKRNSH